MINTPFIIDAICGSPHTNFTTLMRRLSGLGMSVFIIILLAVAVPANADLTFGNGGKVISSPDGSEATFGQDYALQADGKIIAVGGGSTFGFLIVRYNSNGSLDTTFGNNGLSSMIFGDQSGSAVAVDIQADGKIVAGGTVCRVVNNMGICDFGIARFNPDGSVDTTFDGDGRATVSFNPEVITNGFAVERLSSLKVANDGKIVLGGQVTDPTVSSQFILTRLNADGTLDNTFGTNGRIVGERSYVFLNDLTVLADGSVIAVGKGTIVGTRIAIKYNSSGGIVWNYSRSDGEFIQGGLNGVAVQPDGKLIVVGVRLNRVVAIRLNADGTEDNSFNNSTTTLSGEAFSAAVQPDGKIVANFMPSNGWGDTRNSFNVIRYNSNGSLDSSFGIGGILNNGVSSGLDHGKKILVQSDGKILVGGYSSLGNPTKYFFAMTRLLGSFTVTRRALFDYDGDGKSDVSVYRPSDGSWYLNRSSNGFLAVQFGISTDRIVPADYDGDGKTDLAIYRSGDWWIFQSGSNSVRAVNFGLAEDKPQTGDFDGDGRDDLVVFRPSTSVWYVLRSSDNAFTATLWGVGADIPRTGDYDGDGRADIAVFRPSNGVWYIQRSLGGNLFIPFGSNGDKPVSADYDGDGRTDVAIFRPSTNQWFISKSSDGQPIITPFGLLGDIPVPADYDGDGKADISLYRPSNSVWYQRLSTQGSTQQLFGLSNDLPTPGAYNQ